MSTARREQSTTTTLQQPFFWQPPTQPQDNHHRSSRKHRDRIPVPDPAPGASRSEYASDARVTSPQPSAAQYNAYTPSTNRAQPSAPPPAASTSRAQQSYAPPTPATPQPGQSYTPVHKHANPDAYNLRAYVQQKRTAKNSSRDSLAHPSGASPTTNQQDDQRARPNEGKEKDRNRDASRTVGRDAEESDRERSRRHREDKERERERERQRDERGRHSEDKHRERTKDREKESRSRPSADGRGKESDSDSDHRRAYPSHATKYRTPPISSSSPASVPNVAAPTPSNQQHEFPTHRHAATPVITPSSQSRPTDDRRKDIPPQQSEMPVYLPDRDKNHEQRTAPERAASAAPRAEYSAAPQASRPKAADRPKDTNDSGFFSTNFFSRSSRRTTSTPQPAGQPERPPPPVASNESSSAADTRYKAGSTTTKFAMISVDPQSSKAPRPSAERPRERTISHPVTSPQYQARTAHAPSPGAPRVPAQVVPNQYQAGSSQYPTGQAPPVSQPVEHRAASTQPHASGAYPTPVSQVQASLISSPASAGVYSPGLNYTPRISPNNGTRAVPETPAYREGGLPAHSPPIAPSAAVPAYFSVHVPTPARPDLLRQEQTHDPYGRTVVSPGISHITSTTVDTAATIAASSDYRDSPNHFAPPSGHHVSGLPQTHVPPAHVSKNYPAQSPSVPPAGYQPNNSHAIAHAPPYVPQPTTSQGWNNAGPTAGNGTKTNAWGNYSPNAQVTTQPLGRVQSRDANTPRFPVVEPSTPSSGQSLPIHTPGSRGMSQKSLPLPTAQIGAADMSYLPADRAAVVSPMGIQNSQSQAHSHSSSSQARMPPPASAAQLHAHSSNGSYPSGHHLQPAASNQMPARPAYTPSAAYMTPSSATAPPPSLHNSKASISKASISGHSGHAPPIAASNASHMNVPAVVAKNPSHDSSIRGAGRLTSAQAYASTVKAALVTAEAPAVVPRNPSRDSANRVAAPNAGLDRIPSRDQPQPFPSTQEKAGRAPSILNVPVRKNKLSKPPPVRSQTAPVAQPPSNSATQRHARTTSESYAPVVDLAGRLLNPRSNNVLTKATLPDGLARTPSASSMQPSGRTPSLAPSSRDSSQERKKKGVFSRIFGSGSKTADARPLEPYWNAPKVPHPQPQQPQSRPPSRQHPQPPPAAAPATYAPSPAPVKPSAASQAPPAAPISKDYARRRPAVTPVTIPLPVPVHSADRKSPTAKAFKPNFRFLAPKRHRTISTASLDAMDGTAYNGLSTHPSMSTLSTMITTSVQPPPVREPGLATEEWRNREEATQRGRRPDRRTRPGVTFDVDEDPPDEILQSRVPLARANSGRMRRRPNK